MFKLTCHTPTPKTAEVRVEGRLDASGLASLRDTINALAPAAITLDLSGLTWLDREGGAALVRLRNSGCVLRGGSLYVTRLLEEF